MFLLAKFAPCFMLLAWRAQGLRLRSGDHHPLRAEAQPIFWPMSEGEARHVGDSRG
jgi:hypothetical protein